MKVTCSIDGCNFDQKTLHLVDDHGVDVWLCDEHYKQHRKFERDLRKALKEVIKK